MSNNVTYAISIESAQAIQNLQNVAQGFTKLQGIANQVKQISLSSMIQNVQSLSEGLTSLAKPGMQFQQQIADIQAITGIAGKDLQELSVTAREVGISSGLGASQAAEAFKILASNIDVTAIGGVEGLKKLQKETIALSQAAGVDLPTAATTMSAAINMWGFSANEASRVINVLGAGAKYGAAEIPDLAESLKNAGATAATAGVSIEGTVAALEVLLQNAQKGAEAGTGLRGVIVKLQTKLGIDLKKNSLSDVFTSLKPKLNDVTYLTKIFGEENLKTAQILIKNSGSLSEMTKNVTGTNVAYEQAAIRTETYQQSMARVKAQIDDFKISIFNATGAFLPWSEVVGGVLADVAKLAPALSLIGPPLKASSLAVWDFLKGLNYKNIALKIAAAAQATYSTVVGLVTGRIQIATVAQQVWNAAVKASPIFWIIGGIAAAAAATYGLVKALNQASAAQRLVADMSRQVGSAVIEERSKVDMLIGVIRNQNSTREQQVAALTKLKEISSEHFGNLTIEEALTSKLAEAAERYNNALIKKSAISAIEDKVKENSKRILELNNSKIEGSLFTSNRDIAFAKKAKDEEIAKIVEDNKLLMSAASYFEGYTTIKGVKNPFATKPITATPVTGGGTGDDKTGGKNKNGDPFSAANNITAGGSRPTSITINLQKLQDKIEIHSTNLKEGVAEMESTLIEALLRVLNSANKAVS